MTEEIIIDGVNVAGCKFLEEAVRYNNKAVCSCTDVRDCEGDLFIECCGEKPNCYYKQLKRLEQENKELKEKIIELSEEKGHLIVENNTLKESNQSLSMLGTDLVSANETVRKEFFRADKNKDMWREKAEKYRSALEEIKAMINHPDHRGLLNKIEDRINEVIK